MHSSMESNCETRVVHTVCGHITENTGSNSSKTHQTTTAAYGWCRMCRDHYRPGDINVEQVVLNYWLYKQEHGWNVAVHPSSVPGSALFDSTTTHDTQQRTALLDVSATVAVLFPKVDLRQIIQDGKHHQTLADMSAVAVAVRDGTLDWVRRHSASLRAELQARQARIALMNKPLPATPTCRTPPSPPRTPGRSPPRPRSRLAECSIHGKCTAGCELDLNCDQCSNIFLQESTVRPRSPYAGRQSYTHGEWI